MFGVAEYTFSLVGQAEETVTVTANSLDWAWELAKEEAKSKNQEIEDFLDKEEVK